MSSSVIHLILRTVVTTVHSGEVASVKLKEDVATAHTQGEKLVADFFKERIFSRDKEFDAAIHRFLRESFTNQPTLEKNSNLMQNKTVEMENKAMAEVVSLEENMSLDEIMNHRITDECLSIYNINGSMVKVQKSKLVQMLNRKETPGLQLQTYISIVNMGCLWRLIGAMQKSMIGAMQKKPTFVVRKTLSSERIKHFHPVRISMTFSGISQTRFAFNNS